MAAPGNNPRTAGKTNMVSLHASVRPSLRWLATPSVLSTSRATAALVESSDDRIKDQMTASHPAAVVVAMVDRGRITKLQA
jgi:hypothetical protein